MESYVVEKRISVTYKELLSLTRQQLSIVGKKAMRADGSSMYSNLTMSSREDELILKDYFHTAAQNICTVLVPLVGRYHEDGADNDISFNIMLTDRYIDANEEESSNKSVFSAVCKAITDYIYTFAVGQYLSLIRPATGEKYPPLYGNQYMERARGILQNIALLVFDKREPKQDEHDYADITAEIIPNS